MLVSGMIIGTVFTLFVVPAIYMLVAKVHSRIEAVDEAALIVPEHGAAAAGAMGD
jgi:multidrug efflux pump